MQQRGFMHKGFQGVRISLWKAKFFMQCKYYEKRCVLCNRESPSMRHRVRDEKILVTIYNNPQISVHHIAHYLDISRSVKFYV